MRQKLKPLPYLRFLQKQMQKSLTAPIIFIDADILKVSGRTARR